MNQMVAITMLGMILAIGSGWAEQPEPSNSPPTKAQPRHVSREDGATGAPGASPERPDSDGCGAGWIVTRRKTFLGTATRATTNVFVPPTFGMTSGTLGCVQHPFVKAGDRQAYLFAAANAEALEVEAAAGGGESVDALAAALGCSVRAAAELGAALQRDYGRVFHAGDVEFFELKRLMRENAILKRGC